MAISKITFNGVTQMDVTQDTVDEDNLLSGETATKANGVRTTGTVVTADVDDTLSISGDAADAKVTGDKINDIERYIGIVDYKIIEMAYIAANGTVSAAATSSPWNLLCFNLHARDTISNITLTSVSQSIVYGLFTSEPSMGSVTFNNTRTTTGALSVDNIYLASTTPWIAIRYNPNDTPKVTIANLADLNKSVLVLGGTTSANLNNVPSNSVIYGSTNTITGNYPSELENVGFFQSLFLDSDNIIQIGYGARGNGIVMRAKVGGTWGAWLRIVDRSEYPAAPTTDGTYTLRCVVSNGTPTYSWVSV